MKNILFVFAILLLTISCSKKDIKFEAISSEAFAFDIGDGTAEVNSTVRVKGFIQTEKDKIYNAEVAYEIDLLKPDSTVEKSIFSFVQKDKENEPISDIALDAQFTLDSTYKAGTYTLIYKIADKNSDKTLEAKINFDLTWD
jgi:hypothetical protein